MNPSHVDLSNEEFGLVSLSNGILGHFLLEDDDDEREDEEDRDDDEREDEEDDDDDDRKDKGKEGSKKDDLKGKDLDDHSKDHGKKDHGPKHDDEPLAQPRTIVTDEDAATKIVLQGRTGNHNVTFSIIDAPDHGSLVDLDVINGTVNYVPSSNFFGRDSFTFTVSDGESDSDPAAVTIYVKGVNDAPIAIGGELVTKEGQPLSVKLTATDADNDTLTYAILTGPDHGSLTGVAPNLNYLPNNHFDGADTLSFKAYDDAVDSNVATIVIKVKSADNDDQRKSSDRWWERTRSVNQGTDVISSSIAYEPAPPPDTADVQTDFNEPQQDQLLSVLPVDLTDATTDVAESTAAALVLKDVLAPQFVFPASPLEAVASSYAGTVVTYAVRAMDDIDGEVTSTCSPSSGSRFPVGKLNVVCTATDSAGNSALSSFIVIVRQASSEDDALATFLLPSALAAVLGVGAYFGIRIMKKRPNSK